jgi:hypothetical protein
MSTKIRSVDEQRDEASLVVVTHHREGRGRKMERRRKLAFRPALRLKVGDREEADELLLRWQESRGVKGGVTGPSVQIVNQSVILANTKMRQTFSE